MKIACPKCGNKDYFTLVLSYLRLSVERGPDGGYVARWDEGECETAYCGVCNTQLELDQAEHLYAHSTIE
ncbi:hypothetical protein SAMN00808754_1639 [Thermanaeromonas toyohensis ToBE]|uniref:Uncharacterized protein n=1 Tax=Thermanaeromonas toyohensis ToBE TaxID=698762 RepID=A0A1W1VTW0_9FIRM|nr:hypothetical protein [Thermanaeromonas toyohensis]SMB96766.1 hypothetical protein SAMN00808754_1639 [Thermanaeromonas toyohensis ToBE]